jgi:anti-anti-sigma regulatory factor
MDLAGVGELVQTLRRTGWEPASIRLVHPAPFVRRILDLTHAGSALPIHDSLDDALAARRARR